MSPYDPNSHSAQDQPVSTARELLPVDTPSQREADCAAVREDLVRLLVDLEIGGSVRARESKWDGWLILSLGSLLCGAYFESIASQRPGATPSVRWFVVLAVPCAVVYAVVCLWVFARARGRK